MVTVVVWVPLRTVTGDNDTVVLTAASQANPTVSDMVHLTTTVSGVTSRVSINSKGWQADRRSFPPPSISDSGRYVAFQSWAGNLVSTDTNGAYDIFVHDRTTGGTSLVSVASDGTQGYGPSQHPSISGNGRFVAFQSEADNLVPSDTNGRADVFVHDRVTGETKRVSVASDGTEANASSDQASISADGRYVAYHSGASNLVPGDTNGRADVFVHDRVTGETTRASVSSDGREGNLSSRSPSISADGRFVAFASEAYNLVPGDHFEMCNVLDVDPFPCRDIFVHDRTTRETTRVSVASHGAAGNDWSGAAAISGNGRYVAFQSHASNLVPGDTNTCHAVYRIGYVAYNCPDIFVHDRTTGVTSLVSVASDGTQGNERSTGGTSISGDGRFVGFRSFASNLVPGDTNETWDVFIHDRTTGQTSRVSIASDGTQGNSNSTGPSISADGRYVAFSSNAVNLVTRDTNGDEDIFVHDRHGGYGWSYLPLISRP
jgi:Tol biopolymer transport system component